MTVTAMPTLRPRDQVIVCAIGGSFVARQMYELAQLRKDHPGGAPMLEPQAWSAAYVGKAMVAALGYFMVQPGHAIVVEVNRSSDHWGAVGLIVLLKQFAKACKRENIRMQALIMPENFRLKRALSKGIAHLAVEVWEPD